MTPTVNGLHLTYELKYFSLNLFKTWSKQDTVSYDPAEWPKRQITANSVDDQHVFNQN